MFGPSERKSSRGSRGWVSEVGREIGRARLGGPGGASGSRRPHGGHARSAKWDLAKMAGHIITRRFKTQHICPTLHFPDHRLFSPFVRRPFRGSEFASTAACLAPLLTCWGGERHVLPEKRKSCKLYSISIPYVYAFTYGSLAPWAESDPENTNACPGMRGQPPWIILTSASRTTKDCRPSYSQILLAIIGGSM